jgi:hypothetical protein
MKNGVDANHLPQARDITNEHTAVKAFSEVLAGVHHANRELAKTSRYADHDDLSKRLMDWILRVHEIMKPIIKYLPHAASYSVTVGTTITMTMNFVRLPWDSDRQEPPADADGIGLADRGFSGSETAVSTTT